MIRMEDGKRMLKIIESKQDCIVRVFSQVMYFF